MAQEYTATQREILRACKEFRAQQIKRQINAEKNEAVKKIRQKELDDLNAIVI